MSNDAPPGPGRPCTYTPEIAAEICRRLAEGETLRAICRSDDMPHESTVRSWALDDREGFSTHYTRARELGYLRLADEILEIADDSSSDTLKDDQGNERLNTEFVARSRIRIDTRKWLLSKCLPKVYGDKLDLSNSDGSLTVKILSFSESHGEGD